MLDKSEYKKLVSACKKLAEGPDYRNSDYVSNLQITALDFQLRVATVNDAMDYYKKEHWKFIRTHKQLIDFINSHENTKRGNTAGAKALWNNRCWTRFQFLRAIVAYFDDKKVCDMKSLKKWAEKTNFENGVRGKIRSTHHSVGPAIYHWLLLRIGFPTIKPDLHVRRFVQGHIDRMPNPNEAVDALVKCANELNRKPHELDAAIWHAQSGNE